MAIIETFAAARFILSTITVSSESVVEGSTPAARVTWHTTIPPQCIAFYRVEFRKSSFGPVVANYTTTNVSQTEVIKKGLQPVTMYYISVVVVAGEAPDGTHPTLRSREMRLLSGGKHTTTCTLKNSYYLMSDKFVSLQVI